MTNTSQKMDDYDYIVKIISYLDLQFGVRFFISPRDFDLLFRWWEKRIPLEVIRESLTNVVERRRGRSQSISGFANFNYEVKKNFKGFLELTVGEGDRVEADVAAKNPLDVFFDDFPAELEPLRPLFLHMKERMARKEDIDAEALDDALLELFSRDDELGMKVQIFLNSLAPPLRNKKIEKKYRLNYLKRKFRVPGFEE